MVEEPWYDVFLPSQAVTLVLQRPMQSQSLRTTTTTTFQVPAFALGTRKVPQPASVALLYEVLLYVRGEERSHVRVPDDASVSLDSSCN